MKNIYKPLLFLLLLVNFTSCKDFFDPDGNDIIKEDDYIKEYSELFMGYLGVAQSVQEVAEKSIYLEGLRGLPFIPASNVMDQDYWDVYYYNDYTLGAFTGNKLASPEGYYKVILNANDYLYHAGEYYTENPRAIEDIEFAAFIGATLRWKSWAYLQLAKIYGQAVYIDDPLLGLKDVKDFPLWSQEQVIAKAIDLIEVGTTINGTRFDGKADLDDWYAYLDPEAAETEVKRWNMMNIPYQVLLAELYLYIDNWQGVIDNAFAFINSIPDGQAYILSGTERKSTDQWIYFWITNKDMSMTGEVISAMYYEFEWDQTNTLRNHFSPYSPFEFLLKPSDWVIEKAGRNEPRIFNYDTDNATRIQFNTFAPAVQTTGEWFFNKYAGVNSRYDYQALAVYDVIPWIITARAGWLWLFVAEALANQGNVEAGYWVLNGTRTVNPGSDYIFRTMFVNGEYTGFLTGFPPRLVAATNAFMGIRGRGDADPKGDWIIETPNPNIEIDKRSLDSLVIEEYLLETTGEAMHYYAMQRIVKRRPEMLPIFAEQVAKKYEGTGYENTIYNILSTSADNWFIKYELRDLD